jgi:hypothetical protein
MIIRTVTSATSTAGVQCGPSRSCPESGTVTVSALRRQRPPGMSHAEASTTLRRILRLFGLRLSRGLGDGRGDGDDLDGRDVGHAGCRR